MTLLETIQHDTALKRHASTRGGEYCGPCPFCGGRVMADCDTLTLRTWKYFHILSTKRWARYGRL